MTHRLATNCAKNYCNRTPIVKVIVENVVTCFLGHGVEQEHKRKTRLTGYICCRLGRTRGEQAPMFTDITQCAGTHQSYTKMLLQNGMA